MSRRIEYDLLLRRSPAGTDKNSEVSVGQSVTDMVKAATAANAGIMGMDGVPPQVKMQIAASNSEFLDGILKDHVEKTRVKGRLMDKE